MNGRVRLTILSALILALGIMIGYLLAARPVAEQPKYEETAWPFENTTLPEDLITALRRFTLINRSTNQTLEKFKIIGFTKGSYQEGGEVFETYVLGFEDRYGGAEADIDYLDLLVEMKRAIGEKSVTIRMVQLGLDTIDVYLDGRLIGSVRPSIEIQI